MPVKEAGCLIEPPVSVPIVIGVKLAANAEADPPEDPPGTKFLWIGLWTFPKKLVSLDDAKAKKLEADLNSIFAFIEKLNELDTDKVEPLTSIAETTLKFRTDEVKSKDIRNQILKNSPEKNEDFFVVPKVVE